MTDAGRDMARWCGLTRLAVAAGAWALITSATSSHASHESRGDVVEYRHDRLSRLVDQRTYLSSDGLNASSSNRDPSQGGGDGVITFTHAWDAASRIRSSTDDSGNTTTWTHDGLSLPTLIEFGDGTSETRDYSLDGELREVRRQDGSVQTWSTDAEGRPTSLVVNPAPFSGPELESTWTYDGLGRLVADHSRGFDNDGVGYEYWYDSLSRKILERQSLDGTYDPPLDIEATYEGTQLVRRRQPSGRYLSYASDAAGRPFRIREGLSGPLIAEYAWVGGRLLRQSFGYGVVMDRRDPMTGSSISGSSAGYDVNGRPVRATWSSPHGSVAEWVSTWNGPGGVGTSRRVAERRTFMLDMPVTKTDSWILDSAYRQVSFNRNGAPAIRLLDGVNKSVQHVEDGLAHAMEVDGDPGEAGMNQYSAIDLVPRAYSDTGSLMDDGARRFTWDPRDRLLSVREGATTVITHVRSADGRAVLSGTPGAMKRHVYWGWQEVEERQVGSSGVVREYVTGPGIDQHVQMRDSTGNVSYYVSSELGSVGVLTDPMGWPIETYEYTWLGRPLIRQAYMPDLLEASPRGNPFLFQGARWEPETGLYDFRNRHYDPAWGEFVSIDPLGIWAHGMGNGYEAFGGDGWNARDPWGQRPLRDLPREFYNTLVHDIPRAFAEMAPRFVGAVRRLPTDMAEPVEQIAAFHAIELDATANGIWHQTLPGMFADDIELPYIAELRAAHPDLASASDDVLDAQAKAGLVKLVAGLAGAAIWNSGPCPRTPTTSGAAGGAPKLLGPGTNIGSKIEKQMASRGWNRQAIDKLIADPHSTRVVRDTRHLPDGSQLDDVATAYINSRGHYVIRNDRTGDIIQVSNRYDLDWVAPWE